MRKKRHYASGPDDTGLTKLLDTLAPSTIASVLSLARAGPLTYVNVVGVTHVSMVWFGFLTAFIAFFAASDFYVGITLMDMRQQPSITMHERVRFTVYPLVAVSCLGHLMIAAIGLTKMPSNLAPFLWVSVPLTLTISIIHALQLHQGAIIDRGIYEPLSSSTGPGNQRDQSTWIGPVQTIYTTQRAVIEASSEPRHRPTHQFLIDDSQVVPTPSDHPIYGSSLPIDPREHSSSQGNQPHISVREADRSSNVDALQREFSIMALKPGFLGSESGWEHVVAFGIFTALLCILLAQCSLLIAVKDDISAAVVSCSIVLVCSEVLATVSYYGKTRKRLVPADRRTISKKSGRIERVSKWFILIWPVMAFVNLGLYVGTSAYGRVSFDLEEPTKFVGRENRAVGGLAATYMIAFCFELALGGLYGSLNFGISIGNALDGLYERLGVDDIVLY